MQMDDIIRTRVAGAARSLWASSNGGVSAKALLMSAAGAQIIHCEAMQKLIIKDPAFMGMSLYDYAQFCSLRRRTASNAEYLVINRGATSSWLCGASPVQIERCADVARSADKNLGQFREMAGGRVTDPMTGQKAYTLEDMRTAYRLGFLAATDRTEEAAAYFNTNGFSEDREAALGRL